MGLIYSAPILCLKLLAAAIAAAVGYSRPRANNFFWSTTDSIDGFEFKKKYIRNKNANSTYLTVDLPTQIAFELRHETRFEKWFLKNRLTEEIQTNDPSFDPAVYIKSDSPSLANALRSSISARTAIHQMLDIHDTGDSFIAGQSIVLDSAKLRVQLRGDQRENQKAFKAFATLHKALTDLTATMDPNDDKFAKPARAFEAMIWALLVYGYGSFIEATSTLDNKFVHTMDYIKASGIGALALLCIVTVTIFAVLQNSSRLPRIIAGYAFVGVFATALSGAGLVSDIDRYGDSSPPIIVDRAVTRLDQIDRHSSKGPKFRYEGCFVPVDAASIPDEVTALKLPRCMSLSYSQFHQLHMNKPAKFWIRRGALGLPWYEAIQAAANP